MPVVNQLTNDLLKNRSCQSTAGTWGAIFIVLFSYNGGTLGGAGERVTKSPLVDSKVLKTRFHLC
jgi:hypothetical protein